MSRIIFLTFIFTLVGGILLYTQTDMPFFNLWFGKLPGDMILTKGKILVYLPIVSSFSVSLVFSCLIGFIFKK